MHFHAVERIVRERPSTFHVLQSTQGVTTYASQTECQVHGKSNSSEEETGNQGAFHDNNTVSATLHAESIELAKSEEEKARAKSDSGDNSKVPATSQAQSMQEARDPLDLGISSRILSK